MAIFNWDQDMGMIGTASRQKSLNETPLDTLRDASSTQEKWQKD